MALREYPEIIEVEEDFWGEALRVLVVWPSGPHKRRQRDAYGGLTAAEASDLIEALTSGRLSPGGPDS